MKNLNKVLANKSIREVAIIMFLLGLGIGLILMIMGLLSQNYIKDQATIVKEEKSIDTQDISPIPKIDNNITVKIDEIVSDNLIKASIINSNKAVTIRLNNDTKYIQKTTKNIEELSKEIEEYRKNKENDSSLIPPPAHIETESSKENLKEGSIINIESESSLIGETEIQAKTIKFN